MGVNPDEAFTACKLIDKVMEAQKDLVDILVEMHPRVVLMGGTDRSDDGNLIRRKRLTTAAKV